MASVDFMKLKTASSVKAMLRHCDREERQDGKEHANKEINPSATARNLQLNRSYAETCKMYDDRLKELDSVPGANRRKDRVTCFGLSVPVPDGLSEADEEAFFSMVGKIIKEQYGKENLLQSYIHRDEKHKYKDVDTGRERMSRTHAHFYVIPEINGKLNGKEFSKKANMVKLNKAIDDMSLKMFHRCFMTGAKRKSRKSVEELKNESRAREIEDEAKKARMDAKLKLADVEALKADLSRQKQILDDLLVDTEKALKSLSDASERYNSQDAPPESLVKFTKNIKYRDGSTAFDKYAEQQVKKHTAMDAQRREAEAKAKNVIRRGHEFDDILKPTQSSSEFEF